jgi:hypothetical protein
MATTDTPDEATPAATVTSLPTPKPEKTRWSGQLPTKWTEWLETTADARMCSEALLVAKGLELLEGHLPPLP